MSDSKRAPTQSSGVGSSVYQTSTDSAAQAQATHAALKAKGISLTRDEEKEFREIFNLVDTDKSGTISKEELISLMETLAIKASPVEIDMMVREIDKNNDGEIQFEEFVAVMSRKVQATYTSEEVKNAFKVFEAGCPSGYIKLSNLESALKHYGQDKLSAEQISELVAQIEGEAKDGLFNYEEYVNMMMAD